MSLVNFESASAVSRVSRWSWVSLILGLLSLPLFFLKFGLLPIICGIIGLLRRTGKPWPAIIGILSGILSIAFSLVTFSTYFNLAFNPTHFTAEKSAVSRQVLDQEVALLERYKETHGTYPSHLYDESPGTISINADFYGPFYYQASSDGTSYSLWSLGPDGRCGTADDILPSNAVRPPTVDCQIDLGDARSQPVSALASGNDFAATTVYQDPTYGYAIRYPSTWRIAHIDSLYHPKEEGVQFGNVDTTHPTCEDCFGGMELKVLAYSTAELKAHVSNPLDFFINSADLSAPPLQRSTFLGYDAVIRDETMTRNLQYMGQKIREKTIAFQRGPTVFAISYQIDATLPGADSLESLIRTFHFTDASNVVQAASSSSSSVSIQSAGTTNARFYDEAHGFSIDYPPYTHVESPIKPQTGGEEIWMHFPLPPSAAILTRSLIIDLGTSNYQNGVLRPDTCTPDHPDIPVTTVELNGQSFASFDVSGEFGGTETAGAATEYCAMRGNTIYKIVAAIDYNRYKQQPDVSKELSYFDPFLATVTLPR